MRFLWDGREGDRREGREQEKRERDEREGREQEKRDGSIRREREMEEREGSKRRGRETEEREGSKRRRGEEGSKRSTNIFLMLTTRCKDTMVSMQYFYKKAAMYNKLNYNT